MKRKCTAAIAAQIKARRAQGAQIADLAREFGLGYATIHRALGAKGTSTAAVEPKSTAKTTRKATTVAQPSDGELPTTDDLRRSLATQVRALQTEIEAAETPSARAAMNRILVATQQLLTRITPAPNLAAGMMLVPVDAMEAESEKGQGRLQQLVSAVFADRATWRVCPACHRPVPPSPEELERRGLALIEKMEVP